ncbi:hypothetical protein NLJ89_g11019 [Agrocybe chaxingu]|uniref:Uncharacterized protein n=1 Tax=Agrocybe chaxingu TaxID=84603 RepID=A0A9W8JXK0_9AGAR|nr:hypothetical protein NLJ89_g11019 [Agrocybe chaxingu]
MPSTSTTSHPLAKSSGRIKSPGSAQSTALIDSPHSSLMFSQCHIVQNNDQRGTSWKGFEVLCDNIDESLLHDSTDHDTEDFDCPSSGTEREMIEQIMEWAENPVHVARAALVHSPTTVGGVPTLGHSIFKRCKEDDILLASISLPSTTIWDKKRDASADGGQWQHSHTKSRSHALPLAPLSRQPSSTTLRYSEGLFGLKLRG